MQIPFMLKRIDSANGASYTRHRNVERSYGGGGTLVSRNKRKVAVFVLFVYLLLLSAVVTYSAVSSDPRASGITVLCTFLIVLSMVVLVHVVMIIAYYLVEIFVNDTPDTDD